MIGEFIRILVYLPTFMNYYKSQEYSLRVFIFFVILDFIRIGYSICIRNPCFTIKQEYAQNPETNSPGFLLQIGNSAVI